MIRNVDGTKKGIETDPFIPGEISKEPLPTRVMEGINIIDSATVTLVLYDKDTQGNHIDYAYLTGDFVTKTMYKQFIDACHKRCGAD